MARDDQLEMITNLNLTLAKEGGKKIKVWNRPNLNLTLAKEGDKKIKVWNWPKS
jgi:hypothetical protein